MQTAQCLGLLLVVLLHGAAHAAGRPKLTPVRVKGPAYNPGLWNSTCKYSAYAIPPAELFRGQQYADKSMLVPLHADSPTAAAFKYPISACFGPGQRYDQAKVAAGKKLPCQYRFTRDFTVDYWEEQPCARTLLANCYCYALDRSPGGYCIPGGAKNLGRKWTCSLLSRAIIADGGTRVDLATVRTKQPRGTHYIAAGIAPETSQQGNDFHLWRRDANGAWSWKAGFTFARNSYRNGTLVRDLSDPSIRRMYPVFCGYFDVSSKTHKLHASPGGTRSTLPGRLGAWKRAGWRTRVTRLAARSKGWYGLYQYVYVGQSYGDVAYGQQAAATRRRKGTYSADLEAWRSQPEATVALTRTRTRRQGRG